MTVLASFLDLWLWQLVYAFVGFLVSWFVYSSYKYEIRLKKIISLQKVVLKKVQIEASTLDKENKNRTDLFTRELLNMKEQVHHLKTTYNTEIEQLEITSLFDKCENILDTYTRVWQKL